ncbi:MAG: hypothetical protein ABWX92_06520 [Mycetocola sp.]
MIEYRVQYANYSSEKTGEELADEIMSLEQARAWISEHPQTEYVILQREAGSSLSLWSPLPCVNNQGSTGQ